jgi:hypothetical protein
LTKKTLLLHLEDQGSQSPLTVLLEYLALSKSVALTAVMASCETVDTLDEAIEKLDPKDYSFVWVSLKDAKRLHEALGELLKEAEK